MDAMKSFLLAYFIPEKCYDEFFVRLQLFHVPCLRIALRKTLGIWVMLGSLTAKLPQMFKVVGAKSSEGLSLPSSLVELYAAAGTVAVQIGRNFPLDAWGDSLFILVQMVVITFLILHYRGHTVRAPAGVDLLPDWPHGAALCSLHLPAVCRLPGPAHLLRPGDGRADEDPALRDHLLLRWSPGSSDVVLLGPWARPEEEGGVAESTTVSSQTASRTSSRIYSVL
ncbi:mannose-P-dolichol utilization defect 1 protein-like isoform X2 [Paramormyrops kingsleyae]|uniref:mannose-P-dolichol utilization defect 1 protein-like isoform X2 n=1 Tax=Paramormyrops kingsleyae TaxID=1676925 RepID=UPI003B96C6B9